MDISKAPNFSSLLSSIREHLRSSPCTQEYYVAAATKMFYKLFGAQDQGGPVQVPCHNDFVQFVVHHWPTVKSFRGSVLANTVLWGRVSKCKNSPNEIEINNSLIVQAEAVSSYLRSQSDTLKLIYCSSCRPVQIPTLTYQLPCIT